jgi:hypothetical protein
MEGFVQNNFTRKGLKRRRTMLGATHERQTFCEHCSPADNVWHVLVTANSE